MAGLTIGWERQVLSDMSDDASISAQAKMPEQVEMPSLCVCVCVCIYMYVAFVFYSSVFCS